MGDVPKVISKKVAREVGEKVKSAIEAKLVELGVFVDHELINYIMLLVANKKKRLQMEEDLSLFLEGNTLLFTGWLRGVLKKLDAASILPGSEGMLESSIKQKSSEDKKPDIETSKSKKLENIDEFLHLPPSLEKLLEPVKTKISQPVKTNPEIPVTFEKKEKKKKKDKDKEKKKKDKKEKKKKKDKDREKEKSSSKSSKSSSKSVPKENTIREGSMPSSPKETVIDPLKKDDLSPPCLSIAVEGDGSSVVNSTTAPSSVDELEPISKDLSCRGSPKLKAEDGLIEKVEKKEEFNTKLSDLLPSEADFSPDALNNLVHEDEVDSGTEEDSRKQSTDNAHKVSIALQVPKISNQKIINLREESSFPSKPKDVTESRTILKDAGPDNDRPKRLEARVRPMVSSSQSPPLVRKKMVSSLPRIASTIGAVAKRAHSDDEDDYDDDDRVNSRITGVISKVETAPRPKRPKSHVANTNLIMRAMADAHKSINVKQKRKELEGENDVEGQAPKKKAFYTKGYISRTKNELCSDRQLKSRSRMKSGALPSNSVTVRMENVEMSDEDMYSESNSSMDSSEDSYEEMEEVEITKPFVMKSHISKPAYSVENSAIVSDRYVTAVDNYSYDPNDLRSKLCSKPVTKLIPKVNNIVPKEPVVPMEEEYIEEVEEWVEETMEVDKTAATNDQTVPVKHYQAALQQAQQLPTGVVSHKDTRCHFWPLCALKDECPFFHPIEKCTNFPACRYGATCLYVHPTCSFNSMCSKQQCPFVHTEKPGSQPGSAAGGVSKQFSTSISEVMCRYFPRCLDANCRFKHPIAPAPQTVKACHYGKACQTPSCPFQHVPSASKLKWTATTVQKQHVPNITNKMVPPSVTASKSLVFKAVVDEKPAVVENSVAVAEEIQLKNTGVTESINNPVNGETRVVKSESNDVQNGE